MSIHAIINELDAWIYDDQGFADLAPAEEAELVLAQDHLKNFLEMLQ
jgi:2-hydroxy-3-keto-5-methylthiopentenyl-1-phosphate phosphatase